ncbi:MAG: C1 family peptidase [Polyangiales bacterium]
MLAACAKPAGKKSESKKDDVAQASKGGDACGSVDLDGTKILLDCNEPGYGNVPGASKTPFKAHLKDDGPEPFEQDSKKPTKLKKEVDHRKDKTEGPVRDQGPVGACTAFSLAAAVDHSLLRNSDEADPVSVMHIWARYAKPSMADAAKKNSDEPIGMEDSWPYDADKACSWLDPDFCRKGCGKPASYCGYEPSEKKVKKLDKKSVATISQIVRLDLDDAHGFREALSKGQDIWIAIKLTTKFVQVKGDTVPDYDAGNSLAGHALVIAGYRKRDGEYQYLLHNSWGKKWGDKGYAWIGEDTLFKNLQYAYLVDAEPTDDTGSTQKQSYTPKIFSMGGRVAMATCTKGEVPDAVTKSCGKPCADGSPPANGQCAKQDSECGVGARVAGSCVQAAPSKSGSDAKSGVTWSCGAGGCTYAIPKGQYGCKDQTCHLSCAAPRFHMSFGDKGLGCIE